MNKSSKLIRQRGHTTTTRRLAGGLLWVLAVVSVPITAPAQLTRSYPHDQHYGSFRPYFEGDFLEARRAFQSVPVMKSTQGVFVDSIAHHAMIGECLYQMGDLAGALQQYTTALRVYADHSDWLLKMTIPPALTESNRASRRSVPWGAPTRPVRVANIPERLQMLMGNTDEMNLQVLQSGGTLRTRYILMLDAQEIVRCTALAIRRRTEILGPAGEHDTLNNELVAKLSRRPAPQGSWAQAWVGVHLGLAKASVGKNLEAVSELQGALLAAGMDHNLTSTALLELGKLQYAAEDYAAAGSLFFEAACSAALMAEEDVTQYDILCEAFRWGAISHLSTSPGTFSAPLGAAAEWARRGHPYVEASLLLSAAENCTSINDTVRARGYLDRAAHAMRRRECLNGELGARFQFATAQASVQAGDSKRGMAALANALAFQRKASRRLFQILLSDRLFTSGAVTTRQAGLLYEKVLRDPTPHDWRQDPLESLSVLTIPHAAVYEHWFLLALDRKENDNALRISEALRRHRFYSSLPLGGRLLNLRWMLEAPLVNLPNDIALRRQDLWNRFPAVAELSQKSNQLRAELAQLPISSEDPAEQRKINDLQRSLESTGESMELLLEMLALSREPSEALFPPRTDVTVVQQKLQPDQRVIAYVSTSNATFAFMLGAENYSTWQLESPGSIKSNVAKMLREMGQYDRNQQLGIKELTDETWKATAAQVLQDLTADAPASAWDEFSELIVVPDGMLWYLPFEALQIQNGDESSAVLDKVRVRYVPTISLAVPDGRPRARAVRTAVVTGSLFSRASETQSRELLADLKKDDANVYGLTVKPPPATAALAKSIDRLVVLDDLDNDVSGPFDWAPMPVARGSGNLAQWMRSPWGAPDQVLLPGFHTPAENGLKRGGTGDELFLSVCGLLASGSRTILLSRWRDGGRTSHDLVREFVRELPHRSASEAWQRSVRLAVSSDLAWTQEPRVKELPPDTPPLRAKHPLFWGGYLLVDTGVEPKSD